MSGATDSVRSRRSGLRVLRSKLAQSDSGDPAVGSIISEFSSAVVDLGVDEAFLVACETSSMIGPEPGRLAARMGAMSLITAVCERSGLPDPGIDPTSWELMRPRDDGAERR